MGQMSSHNGSLRPDSQTRTKYFPLEGGGGYGYGGGGYGGVGYGGVGYGRGGYGRGGYGRW
jgi:hypothetical protein